MGATVGFTAWGSDFEDHFLAIVIGAGGGIVDGRARTLYSVGAVTEADDGVGHAVGIGCWLADTATGVVFHHPQNTGFAVGGLTGALGITVFVDWRAFWTYSLIGCQ